MAHDNGRWDFDSPIALLRCGPITARVDVSSPQHGLYDLSANSSKIAGALFATEWIAENTAKNSRESAACAGWPMGIADAYVRGGDLVATYGRLPNSPYAPQIYWRWEQGDSPASFGVSLLVSVQTDLLDTHPQIRVSSRLAAEEVIRVPPGCVVWRLVGGEWSYAEFALEHDFRQLTLEANEGGFQTSHWDLFAEFLEKGVIRRAQIHGVFLPRKGDIELAAACYRAAEVRPLPLTT